MNSMETLAVYRSISNITGEMAGAARAGEWEKLTALERHCAALVAQFEAVEPVRLTLTSDVLRQKVELIHKILADDAEIRRHAEPWMERVQTLLGNAGMERRLRRAYDPDAGGGASA
ncbi:flagellar protein FliT [Nitrosospira sp. Nl5]|uniref:flagellar protein FliT n=1 Tax=Nitrosospira sp. Nl5 TaxID=200120 RepID=UPI00087EFF5B|nr:flagellar protein FliT [Nitrosospira sp. Nl5]SCY07499.1 flagellar protein FliT [Nitrosospira sp. Nl5]